MELFNRALDLIAKGQDTCIGIRNLLFPGSGEDSDDGPGDDGGEGNDQDSNTGGKNTRKRKPDTSTKAGRKKRSCSTQHNESSSPPAQTAFDLNYEILKLFKDPKNKEEVGRFLALDQTKVALPFRKTKQLKILCAAFPFDPSRATESLHDEKDLSLLSFAPTPTQRPAALISTDRMLFTFGSFREGFLPDGFCQRLAWVDYPEEAKRLAEWARDHRSIQPISSHDSHTSDHSPLTTTMTGMQAPFKREKPSDLMTVEITRINKFEAPDSPRYRRLGQGGSAQRRPQMERDERKARSLKC